MQAQRVIASVHRINGGSLVTTTVPRTPGMTTPFLACGGSTVPRFALCGLTKVFDQANGAVHSDDAVVGHLPAQELMRNRLARIIHQWSSPSPGTPRAADRVAVGANWPAQGAATTSWEPLVNNPG